MNPDEFFLAGKVVKVSGSGGEVILSFESGILPAIQKTESVFILLEGGLVPFFIEHFHPKGRNQALVKFLDYNLQEDVIRLEGHPILLPLTQHRKKKKNSRYDLSLEGFTVEDKNLGLLGTVVNVLELPMQEILEVEQNGKIIMIPVAEPIILAVDIKKKIIFVDTPEGLVELY